MTSSLAVFEAEIRVKSTHLLKSGLKIRKREILISPNKRLFRHRIHSLLRRPYARGSAEIIYRIWRISLVCASGIVTEVRKYRSRIEYLISTNIVLNSYFNLTNKSNLINRRQCELIRFFDNMIVAYFLGPPCIFRYNCFCRPFHLMLWQLTKHKATVFFG